MAGSPHVPTDQRTPFTFHPLNGLQLSGGQRLAGGAPGGSHRCDVVLQHDGDSLPHRFTALQWDDAITPTTRWHRRLPGRLGFERFGPNGSAASQQSVGLGLIAKTLLTPPPECLFPVSYS